MKNDIVKYVDVQWSDQYKGSDIVINHDTNECVLSHNGINQSIVIDGEIPKGKRMKYDLQINKNQGSGCYFIGVISDVQKCDFNGIAMYGQPLQNAFGVDDTKKWIYRGSNGIDIVEWKPEIKTGDVVSVITEYQTNNELKVTFVLNNKLCIKPHDLSYSMDIPKQKLSSDYKWYVAVSLVETGSSCALKSVAVLQ
mmetsp:Transcript_27380/g.43327  ORF Transcript_27380/g.43327 Transcript_27380/m.43327 type:complete len:196 (-) Transcript_27380:15-602(-)